MDFLPDYRVEGDAGVQYPAKKCRWQHAGPEFGVVRWSRRVRRLLERSIRYFLRQRLSSVYGLPVLLLQNRPLRVDYLLKIRHFLPSNPRCHEFFPTTTSRPAKIPIS